MIRRPPRSTLFPYTTALPISCRSAHATQAAIEDDGAGLREQLADLVRRAELRVARFGGSANGDRSEEHTSELQSQSNLVCRLLLETKTKTISVLSQRASRSTS